MPEPFQILDSAGPRDGVRVIRLHVSYEQKKRKYALVGVCDRLKTLFRVTHVDSVLITYPTIDEALAAL